MSEIIAYASSTRPNYLWSAAQFNSALPKNRLDADIPLVSKADADDLHERLLGLELLAWKWMGAHDCLKSGREYSLPRTTDKPKLVQLVETLTKALEEIRDLQPQEFNAYPSDWQEQRDACDDCQRYKDHPLMRGICDTHRKPMYDRESHDAHQVRSLGYRAKSMARDALDALHTAKEISA